MKKRILFISIFLLLGLVLTYIITIPKSKAWVYNLPNNYVIDKKNDTIVTLNISDDNEIKVVVSDYIAEFSYGKRYILLKCLDNKEELKLKFYIVDSLTKNIYGPYLEYQEFLENQKKIVDEEVCEYIKTINY